MKVTVIIPSLYDTTSQYLELAVRSLRSTVDWDIIVVTNGGSAPTNISQKVPGTTVHLHTPQQGQCNAVNIGAQVASTNTDYLMVINDDMYFAPEWNKHLKFKDLVFSPNLVEPVNNAGSAPPFLKFDGGLTIEEFKKKAVDTYIHKKVREVPILEDGFNLPFFIRKDVWQTIGGYDTKYDPWGSNSDTDLQTKIELAGIKPKRYRDMLVYHFGSKSGTFDGTKQDYWWRNFNYYTDKFGFNRDMEPKADTWYCKDMIHYDKLKFKPPWLDKYKGQHGA